MAIKINVDLGFLNNLFKSSSPKGNSPVAASPKPAAKPQSQQTPKKASEFEEKLKREFNYYMEYLKKEKSAKVLLGLFSFLVVSSIAYFLFFSDAPLVFNIIAIIFITLIGTGAFFLELMLLMRRQFLVGVFIVDAYFFVYRKIMVQLKKHPRKTPWLLEKFRSILRINVPFFRRVTKEQYAKMSAKERETYMKKYNDYLKRLAKTTEEEKKTVVSMTGAASKAPQKPQPKATSPAQKLHQVQQKSILFGKK